MLFVAGDAVMFFADLCCKYLEITDTFLLLIWIVSLILLGEKNLAFLPWIEFNGLLQIFHLFHQYCYSSLLISYFFVFGYHSFE